MEATSTIERSTLDLYRSYPYPLTTARQRRETLAYQICKYRFLGMEQALRGGRVLDAGCGTGRLMNVAKHYDMCEYVGLDQSAASLAYAKKAAEEEEFDRFTPVEGSVFEIPYPDDSFDAVLCWGVLQVTPDPLRGLRELVRVCKPGGFVAIWVYNPFTHWRHNLQKRKINRLAGDDIHRRFGVAHRLYGRKPVADMTPQEISTFFDRFCVPLESNHTYGEILSWFDRLGLEFQGTSPPLRFRDLLSYLRTLDQLVQTYSTDVTGAGLQRMAFRAARWARLIPGSTARQVPFRRPTLLHRAFWQTQLAWHGRRPAAFHASSFAARKLRAGNDDL